MQDLSGIKTGIPGYGFTDYIRNLEAAEKASEGLALRPLKVAVLRSYTAEMIEPVLRLRLLVEGYRPEFSFGGYNGFIQEILDDESFLYRARPDVVLLLIRIEELMPEFARDFGSRPAADWEQEITETARRIGSFCGKILERLSCRIIVQNMVLRDAYWGIYDAQLPEGQVHLVNALNRRLSEELGRRRGAFVWDFNTFAARKGHDSLYDPKMWYTAKNPFRQSAYVLMGEELGKHILSAAGRVKKCIVLDLDNTIWGGVAGEDGPDGIRLGHDYPGNCYREFQEGLLRLYNRGIILAINSKNNDADAMEVIENHPYMALRKRHFAGMEINWNDKAANMRSLAGFLNIGLDSMIFIDDNPAECERVKTGCPEVAVICLPDKPYLIPSVLNSLPGIEKIMLLDEDRKKGEMYMAQNDRKRFEGAFINLDDFLSELGIELEIAAADSFTTPRLAQLTQKTNQMNMTTRRYTEGDIQGFMDGPSSHVFSVSARDRFGDNGVIGAAILKMLDGGCVIDTLLLSCRVIGRGIERAMVAFIADFVRGKGVQTLTAEFFPTAKNKPAEGMYERLGFSKVDENTFTADLDEVDFRYPAHIKISSCVSARKVPS
ncbi:MAG: HAD-IIIC family phosphatase [Deltaproteobacteria bacterium]|nr:HAD-IIIC family phosphatase [Deltaproteobacteria bacterium]